jgi:hypothetical protein
MNACHYMKFALLEVCLLFPTVNCCANLSRVVQARIVFLKYDRSGLVVKTVTFLKMKTKPRFNLTESRTERRPRNCLIIRGVEGDSVRSLFVYGLLSDSVSSSDYRKSNDG